jgi:hypothetical protein
MLFIILKVTHKVWFTSNEAVIDVGKDHIKDLHMIKGFFGKAAGSPKSPARKVP